MSGILKFHNSISSNSTFKSSYKSIGDWALGGRFNGLTMPISLWYNGSTYTVGYESNATNNQVWVVKQTNFNLQSEKVGTGTDGQEPLNHPTPLLLIDDSGYIYVIQNEFHVTPFNLWRSDNPEDISSFSLVGQFDTDGAYLICIKQDDTNVTFITRNGDANSGGFHQSVLEVNLQDASYTKTQITNADYGNTDVRHYIGSQYQVGTSNIYYGIVFHRYDPTINYYKISIWKSTDLQTISNLNATFTKDVVSTSPLTPTELENNFAFVGSDTSLATVVDIKDFIQVNDDFFILYYDGVNYKIEKYLNGNSNAEFSYAFTDLSPKYMFYDTSRILITALDDIDGSGNLFEIDLNLSNLTLIKKLVTGVDFVTLMYYGYPQNLLEIPKDSLYLGIGRSDTSQTPAVGIVPYNIIKK